MPTARTKANRKYNEKAYDRVALTVPKGQKERIKAHAESQGLSLNGYINKLIAEDMEQG
jgi:predicted HicB family RNase H-like nuclease